MPVLYSWERKKGLIGHCATIAKGVRSMRFRVHGHRHADYLFRDLDEYKELWVEIKDALDSITDEMIISEFEGETRQAKSISQAINRLVKRELVKRGWTPESYIFADEEYGAAEKGTWRLDFAKGNLSVEVAFNHRSDIAWNLIKPTLASELNHVQKALQTSGGVIVTATRDMKARGGFDNACGTYEDYVQYLKPLNSMLTAPLVIVGLEAPESFEIAVEKKASGSGKVGRVVEYSVMTFDGELACPRCGGIVSAEDRECPLCGRRLALGAISQPALQRWRSSNGRELCPSALPGADGKGGLAMAGLP